MNSSSVFSLENATIRELTITRINKISSKILFFTKLKNFISENNSDEIIEGTLIVKNSGANPPLIKEIRPKMNDGIRIIHPSFLYLLGNRYLIFIITNLILDESKTIITI